MNNYAQSRLKSYSIYSRADDPTLEKMWHGQTD